MIYECFGRRVQQQRKLAKMTQEQLSEKAGISLSFLGHIERGTRKASVDTLIKLCNALGVSSDMLLQDSLDDDLLCADADLSDSQRRLLREIKIKMIDYTDEVKKENKKKGE